MMSAFSMASRMRPSAPPRKEHAVWDDDAQHAIIGFRRGDHVLHEGEVTVAFGWAAIFVATEGIDVRPDFVAPDLLRERWIGHHPVVDADARDELAWPWGRIVSATAIVSPLAMKASSMSCRKRLISAMAHVPRFFSCPKRDRLRERSRRSILEVLHRFQQHPRRSRRWDRRSTYRVLDRRHSTIRRTTCRGV